MKALNVLKQYPLVTYFPGPITNFGGDAFTFLQKVLVCFPRWRTRGAEMKIQTHKRLKRTLIYYDLDTQYAHIRGSPIHQTTKRYLNNS